jgi:quercetin dioxygenase-like cupin family protein
VEPVDLRDEAKATNTLVISDDTTPDQASAAMKIFGAFNQCMIGVVGFCGQTPWERHPDDELLQILEGQVEVEVLLLDGGAEAFSLRAGSVCTIPRDLWHRQLSVAGAKLLFVTSQHGNEDSKETDPRVQTLRQ